MDTGMSPPPEREREIIASMMEPKTEPETHAERVARIGAVDHPPVLCGMDDCKNPIHREFAGSRKGFCEEHWGRLYVLMKATLREDATLTDAKTIAARARGHVPTGIAGHPRWPDHDPGDEA